MPANFTELTRVQIPALLHMERLGYKFVHRDSLSPEPQSNILTDVFKEAVKNLNPAMREGEIEEKLRELIRIAFVQTDLWCQFDVLILQRILKLYKLC